MTCPESYVNYLVDQTPHFDADILRSINPQHSMIGKVATASWGSFMGNSRYFDRFTNVYANPTREWIPKEYAECEGDPCSPEADEICWGNNRVNYYKEQRNIKTKVLCFDQIRDVSDAKEHTAQIITNVLRPATNTIMSGFIRKRMWDHSGRRWVANSTMAAVGTSTWTASANNEIYWDTDVDPDTVFKLTPQMLMRRVQPLARYGYYQNMVFEGFPGMIELRTDLDTVWDLDKQVTNAALQAQWRYQQWDAANAFWKFGLSGQLGQYAIDTDFDILRFNYLSNPGPGAYRYQVVLPYRNIAADNGLEMEPNPDYDKAQFQMSQIWHRRAAVPPGCGRFSGESRRCRSAAGTWLVNGSSLPTTSAARTTARTRACSTPTSSWPGNRS